MKEFKNNKDFIKGLLSGIILSFLTIPLIILFIMLCNIDDKNNHYNNVHNNKHYNQNKKIKFNNNKVLLNVCLYNNYDNSPLNKSKNNLNLLSDSEKLNEQIKLSKKYLDCYNQAINNVNHENSGLLNQLNIVKTSISNGITLLEEGQRTGDSNKVNEGDKLISEGLHMQESINKSN